MNWAWQSNPPHEEGEFAKSRAKARVDVLAMRDRATRTVAEQSVDADDCRRLLSMLGLDEVSADHHPEITLHHGLRHR
jgi:hypothetical protein